MSLFLMKCILYIIETNGGDDDIFASDHYYDPDYDGVDYTIDLN